MLIDELIARADFKNNGDFLRTRKFPVVDVADVRDLLEIYERELSGDDCRKKMDKKKVEKVEHALTPTGMKKLTDARKALRIHVEESRKRNQRLEDIPPIPKDSQTDFYGFDDGPNEFIHKMHGWGCYEVSDRRYYLHMVFRYYFKQYHDHAVAAGIVIPTPSYQYVLDTIYPNKCANRFPPEFRRFLEDSSRRTVKTVSLPVPLKGSSSEVTYLYNFESVPYVSTLRRKIEAITRDWKNRVKTYKIYPPFLCKGDPNNDLVIERQCYSQKICETKEGLKRLSNVDIDSMEEVGMKIPAAFTAYDEYMLHNFKTPGEQLNERMGFFMMSKYRQIFFELENHALVESLFLASGAGMEILVSFQTFCSRFLKGKYIQKDENLNRSLLMVLVDVCFLFNVVQNRKLAEEDHVKVLMDFVKPLVQLV